MFLDKHIFTFIIILFTASEFYILQLQRMPTYSRFCIELINLLCWMQTRTYKNIIYVQTILVEYENMYTPALQTRQT